VLETAATHAPRLKMTDYLAMTKPRITSAVLLSVTTGFWLGSSGAFRALDLAITLVAAFLVASGAMVLNEYLERDADALMARTSNRPIPSGRIKPHDALRFGVVVSVLGIGALAVLVNVTSALLAGATLGSYLGIYTPLKRRTSLAMMVDVVPGALPTLIGWSASGAALDIRATILFLIVFFWQTPHFLSIAWMYRSDYRTAGIPVLSVVGRGGDIVARQMVLHVCALVPVSLLPAMLGMAGRYYFFIALALGLFFSGVIFYSASDLDRRARNVLRASVIYLTVLFITMMIDRL
jgi:heme o synthase